MGMFYAEAVVWLAKQAWVLMDWALREGPSLEVQRQGHGQLLCCFVLGCGPCHPQAWISDKECFKPWGGVRIRFVGLCFLFLCALWGFIRGQVASTYRLVAPCFIGTESSLCMCACVLRVCGCFISSQLSVFTPQSRDPGSAVYVRGIACYACLQQSLV